MGSQDGSPDAIWIWPTNVCSANRRSFKTRKSVAKRNKRFGYQDILSWGVQVDREIRLEIFHCSFGTSKDSAFSSFHINFDQLQMGQL